MKQVMIAIINELVTILYNYQNFVKGFKENIKVSVLRSSYYRINCKIQVGIHGKTQLIIDSIPSRDRYPPYYVIENHE